MFLSLLSAYQTPIPAVAFSHLFLKAEPSVLMVIELPLGSSSLSILARFLSGRNVSLFLDLWPGLFPRILMLPSTPCFDLMSGLKMTWPVLGSAFLLFLILCGVCHRLC